LRPRKAEVDLASEAGDLLLDLAAFANANILRLETCLASVLDKYTTRDGPVRHHHQSNHTECES
jgi:NTP pyrophosphatase (non-canonical NTP hydrolase)